MVYLGLDDAEYDEFPDEADEQARTRDRAPARQGPPASAAGLPDEPSGIGTVRPISARPGDEDGATGQTITPSGIRPRPQVVRPITVTPNAKPHVVMPTSFNQAQEVADKYKGSQPVIMNLQAADRDLSRRLIDFASGLCYGLGGQMERVANQVYLLTPTNVEVSPEERRRLHERGYDT
jgi:cell division inhibitor SepF